ncbi:MAG: D-alanyl-D-alanine carboxypeptidase family protein [Iamia sp.]
MTKTAGALAALVMTAALALTSVAPASARGVDRAPGAQADDDAPAPGQEYIDLLADLNAEMSALDADIEAANDRKRDLRDASEALEERAADTDDDIIDAANRITALEQALRERIVGTYMAEGTDVGGLDPTVDDGVIRRIYAEARTETDDRLAKRLAHQRGRLEREKGEQADLEDELAAQKDELDEVLADLRDRQAERAETALRLEDAIAEAQRQALLDAAEEARKAEEAAEKARLAQIAADEAAAQRAADLQALLDAAILAQEEADEAAIEASTTTSFAPGGLELCQVGGITVSCLISEELGDLLLAAAADGVVLTGSGYRSTQRQIQLRRSHCDGDVYGQPSGACSPPTARPGSSLHEVGLAIDFESCSSRASACFTWLDEHAAEHGFKNLSSEPWHWTTTGS